MTASEQAQDQFSAFEQEVYELIAKHYPGAIEGDDVPHATCCAALQVIVGTLLMWRLVKSGENEFQFALDAAVRTMADAGRSRYDLAMEFRNERLAGFVQGKDGSVQ